MLPKNKYFRILSNKYIICTILYVVWMAFFDPKDWQLMRSRVNKLDELEKSEKKLSKQISETRNELKLLKTSAESIEKYAREKYMMKKDNEDLFIVNSP